MLKNKGFIVLCYNPSLSSKYWKSLFQPLKKILQSMGYSIKAEFIERELGTRVTWGKCQYDLNNEFNNFKAEKGKWKYFIEQKKQKSKTEKTK